MARLIPETFGRGRHSDAEKKLAEAFRRQLSDEWAVMHSVGLVRHETKRWAEADFVVVGPGGVLCIEAKGGRVARTKGIWSFTDRHGYRNEHREGPFDQAGGAAGALQGWLGAESIRRADGSRFQVGYGVMTPDCVLDTVGPDIEPAILFDQRNSADSIGTWVDRTAAYWRDRLHSPRLTSGEVDCLVQSIRPDFEATLTRSLKVGAVEDELIRFTVQQEQVLDALSENPRVWVRGPAGTGKTLLAIREAIRLRDSGLRVLVLCHTDSLAAAIRTGIDPTGGIEVWTAAGLLHRIVENGGMTSRIPDATPEAVFGNFMPELAALALEAGTGGIYQFDAVVIDEGQELLRGDSLTVIDCLLECGFAGGTWRAFSDPNQAIFGRPRPGAAALLSGGSPVRYRLDVNCRNTQQIVEMSALLSGSEVSAPSPVHGPDVILADDWDLPWTTRALVCVNHILSEGTPTHDLVVLTASRKQCLDLIATSNGLIGGADTSGAVRCSTTAGFKGLESTAVVIAGLGSLDKPTMRRTAYVAATRAKVLLAVALDSTAEPSLRRRVAHYASAVAARVGEAVERERR